MRGAERDHALAMLGSEDDVAGDEDHLSLIKLFYAPGLSILVVKKTIARRSLSPGRQFVAHDCAVSIR